MSSATSVSTEQDRKQVSITVYNQNFGLVREVRELMTQGVNPMALKTMIAGLRKMKQNLTSRLAEAAE